MRGLVNRKAQHGEVAMAASRILPWLASGLGCRDFLATDFSFSAQYWERSGISDFSVVFSLLDARHFDFNTLLEMVGSAGLEPATSCL
jgi:hypothetical protein